MRASRDLSFEHGRNLLKGTLLYPDGEGPWPGVITLQGSGDTARDNFEYFPAIWEIFLAAGIAVFAYDKPGVGESSGNWRDLTLRERADEALEAVRVVGDDPQVLSASVGLFGHSQGGWVAPIAAARRPDQVAFLIVQSGPGVTCQDQCIHDVVHSMRADGYPDSILETGTAFMRSLVAAGERNASFEEVSRDLLADNRDQPWSAYFWIDDEQTWKFFRRSWREDPHPAKVWRDVHCPVLALFGEHDHLLPVRKSIDTLRGALESAGNADVTISVVREANHQFLIAEPDEFIAGYEDAIRGWIEYLRNEQLSIR
jgi:uncharacterized protein